MTDRNELERLLEAATEGPWVVRTIDESIGGIDTACGEFSVAQASIVDRRQPGIRNLTDALSRRQANAALIVWLRNNAQHYLSLMDEVEKLRRDRETLIEFAKSINSWRSDCDSYDRECSNPHRNYCEDVELMELSAGHALRRVNASQALGETHDR